MSARIRWMARTFAVGVSLLVGGLLGEGVLRWREAVAPRQPPAELPAELVGLPSIEGLFTLAKPNLRANYRGALYVTNSKGIRGPEFSATTPPGTFRIAMLGDSVTMGSGVSAEEAYPSQVEHRLQQGGFAERFQVMNFGLSGLPLSAIVENRLPTALAYHPDLLVYGFTVNDLEGPGYRAHTRARREPNRSLLLDLLHENWDLLRDVLWPSRSSYVRELDDNFFHNPKAWGDFLGYLDRLADSARTNNICVVIFLHPQISIFSSWHPWQRHYSAVATAARERGMHVVEGLPLFLGKDATEYRCNIYDWHPNAAAHAILGEALAEGIRNLPAACLPGRAPGS